VKEKINIMHVLHSFDAGGLEEVVINLINHLNPSLFNVCVCSLTKGGAFKNRISQNIKIFELNKRQGNDYLIPFRLMKLFKQEKVQIVHTHNWGTLCEGTLGAKLAHIPIILHQEHGTLISVIKNKKRRILATKFLFSYVENQVITVSNTLRQAIIEFLNIDKSRIITIYNGIDVNKFDIIIDKSLKRKEIGLMNDDIVVGTIGRLAPVKNQKILIQAIGYLLNSVPQIKLIIVGKGPLEEELKTFTQNLNLSNKVLFLGQRDDIPELLKIMDVFSLPSLYEGISITLLEAMASGVPIVATNVGGNSEVVINEETGILIQPNDYIRLAEAINGIIKDKNKATRYTQAAKLQVKNKFSLKKMVMEYEKLYSLFIEKNN